MAKIQSAIASGYCRMGNEVTPIYELRRKKWFDKKVIERVLTGKNQHNLLGQATDPKNHEVIIDGGTSRMVEIISERGVRNYLSKARSVSDECKQLYFASLKNVSDRRPEIVEENPIQPKLMMMPFVKVEKQMDGGYSVDYWNDKQNDDEQRKEAITMLSECIATLISK